jgi:phosphoribosyl-ATP pyrophosphohydrolase/phosphoribosyl-AMP cyclohydrolase
MTIERELTGTLDWDKVDGLVPAIVQHARDGRVLMLGYMNREALGKSLETRQVTFYSRSRQCLWTKGETSGNVLRLEQWWADCDRDALLIQAIPDGPTCHLGTSTCFGELDAAGGGFLDQLSAVVEQRADAGEANSSYTARLLAAGVERCAQKVGEEGVEVALAAVGGDPRKLTSEAADLLYHLLVCLRAADSDLATVIDELKARHRT